MICSKCKSSKVRVRKNYTHGKRSKPVVTAVCTQCGSTDMEAPQDSRRRFRRK